jgi:hypothetical protein
MPLFLTFLFFFHIRYYITVGSHHISYNMMRQEFVSGIASIIRITSHSCDEAGTGCVLAWNWWSEGYSQ